ncbi:MAG TPA: CoA transferase [Candidatus Limnocylindrales bacterium]|nr:CoA transferase [Candidatus Limnocylindrales bacterium]
MNGALDGLRVLDLSRFIAGPICGQILGDMGAEVIKVERPGGEDARFQGPFLGGESLYPMAYNRNKASLTLDTRHAGAGPVLERLVAWADVLVENYRPGTLDAMGFGWDRLHAAYPRLVLTSLSGFGQTGPLARRALFDPIAQAASGLMSLTGEPDGPPLLTGTYIADHVAGLYGVIGTLVALHARAVTGEGQRVDVASLDALVSVLGTRPMAYAMLGERPERLGSRDPYSAPANVFAARGGWVYLHGGTDSLFPRLCAAIGRDDLAADARFGTIDDRIANVDALEAEVSAWTSARTTGEVEEALAAAGVPCSAVADIEGVLASPQLRAREMFVELAGTYAGTATLTGIPVKLDATPGSIRRPPPRAGADTDRILAEVVGLPPGEIEELRASGAI